MKSTMSNLIILMGVVLLAVIAFSCKSKKRAIAAQEVIEKNLTEEEIRQLPKLLDYSKSPCYGFCPHFNLSVYKGGWTIFEGKRYTEKAGIAIMKLSQGQLDTMMQQCEQADIWSAEKSYGMRIQDLPTTTVHLFQEDKDKSVQWRMRQPERLKKLDDHLMAFITTQGWVATRETAKDRDRSARKEIRIDNELIIQLRDKLDGATWAAKYKEYGLHLKKPISKLANMYLFIYDTQLIDAEEIMKLMQEDEKVARAEFNKRLQSRTR